MCCLIFWQRGTSSDTGQVDGIWAVCYFLERKIFMVCWQEEAYVFGV